MFLVSFIITTAILLMSFYLIIEGRFFQPSLQRTKLGKVISWLGRFGLAANIVASFSALVNQWVQLPYGYTLETVYGMAVCLILMALTHMTYEDKQPKCDDVVCTDNFKEAVGNHMFHASYVLMLATVFGLFTIGPYIEKRVFPVLENVSYNNYQMLDDTMFCYEITFTKQRDVQVEHSIFYVSNSKERSYVMASAREGSSIMPIYRKSFDTGPGKTDICVKLPDKSLDWKITPEIKYSTSAPWPYTQTLPTIDVAKKLKKKS